MKVHRPHLRYDDLESFYGELPDVDRRLSVESDLGVWWSYPGDIDTPYRISLVHNTHEIYVIEQDNRGEVDVIVTFDDNAQAERALEGWADHCGRGGMRWIRTLLDKLERTFYCARCSAIGKTTITRDPNERCSEFGHRAWVETSDSQLAADYRRRVFGMAGATNGRSDT